MTESVLLKRDIKMLKEQQQESIALLKQISGQVGLVWGELIAEHISTLTGARYNAKEWDQSDLNGEQGR
jgi:hypothetical protein